MVGGCSKPTVKFQLFEKYCFPVILQKVFFIFNKKFDLSTNLLLVDCEKFFTESECLKILCLSLSFGEISKDTCNQYSFLHIIAFFRRDLMNFTNIIYTWVAHEARSDQSLRVSYTIFIKFI